MIAEGAVKRVEVKEGKRRKWWEADGCPSFFFTEIRPWVTR